MRVCSSCSTSTPIDETGRYCPECGAGFPEDKADPTGATAVLCADPGGSLIGTTIDHQFIVDGVLGGGSFGTVYRGRQLGLDRHVALKVPTAEISTDPVMARRFAREARSAARVHHPGVVAIYAVGTLPDGRPYLAMEMISGTPLDTILADGKLPPLRALAIARDVASALSETHAADVIHRDLKPSNIVWRRDRNGDDRITLVDFGIAVCKPGNADASRLTANGLIGTPHYMSPEQAHGEQVDSRSDLYSLGCILFELLTGETPFDGSGFEVLLAHLGRPVPVPSERVAELPACVDRIIAKLLAKKPDERCQTADELVIRLDEAIAELEGHARLRPKTARSSGIDRAPRRSRWGIGAAVAAIALCAAGFAAYQFTRTDPAVAE
ncbi:MAG TPA: serine/threonine-protein kinase, partial [Kofleriaceae bacterium]|nr:serine/threonine-protein kinase [Kofleriaceae bacterium]